jgi:hypothetical protein
MENVEEVRQWVVNQMAYLDPPAEWRLDAAAALGRFRARAEADRPWRAVWWAAAAALVVAAFLLLPAGRGVAQQVWQFLTVRRVAFIRVNRWPQGVASPQVGIIGTPVPPVPARDVDEAQQRVHYDPRLPRAGVLSGDPKLYTTFGISAGTVVKVRDLELALQKAGVTDQAVPAQWDGARVALHTSAVVIAQWPDVVLAQSLPLTLSAPAGFDFPAFSTVVMRVLGLRPEQAQQLAERMGTTPPWLAPLAQDLAERGTIEEIALRSGPATLLEEAKTITVVWSVPDRVYVLRGTLSRELMIAAADAVH